MTVPAFAFATSNAARRVQTPLPVAVSHTPGVPSQPESPVEFTTTVRPAAAASTTPNVVVATAAKAQTRINGLHLTRITAAPKFEKTNGPPYGADPWYTAHPRVCPPRLAHPVATKSETGPGGLRGHLVSHPTHVPSDLFRTDGIPSRYPIGDVRREVARNE